jgi:hypothetical protein
MRGLVANIKWVMVVSGVLTCTMVFAALAPGAALRSMFGETLEGPLADIVVRSWGVLITLVGGGLIYGAYVPGARALALVVAAASKFTFAVLVLAHGRPYAPRAGVAIGLDLLWVVLFVAYLAAARRPAAVARG